MSLHVETSAPPAATGLDTALAAYREALCFIPSAAACKRLYPEGILRSLIARTELGRALADRVPTAFATVEKIAALDRELRTQIETAQGILAPGQLEEWRQALYPSAQDWWWFPTATNTVDATALSSWRGPLIAILLALSLSLATDISTRFLSNGPDLLGILGVLAQVLLALVAGGSFTVFGRQFLGSFFRRLGLRREHYGKGLIVCALGSFLLLLALRSSLPRVAILYNNHGTQLQREGRLTSAVACYRRAISLTPDYAEAHYNLAHGLETLFDYERAASEYQAAIEADPHLYPAYNNLARIRILKTKDHSGALALLDQALRLAPSNRAEIYVLQKNRGWASLGLGNLGEAERDLRRAIELRADGAAAHCLLAQVFEASNRSQNALLEWEACVADVPGQEAEVETSWLALAQERLALRRVGR